ncbi:MAG: hypothetical protein QXH96_01470 [Candidatus Geothermarchaeota archaeon]
MNYLPNILAEAKSEEERGRWAKSIKRLQKKLSLNLSEILEKALNAIQTGLFSLRIHRGLRNFAYLWKWRDRYFGFAYDEDSDHIPNDWVLASKSFNEAKEFVHTLFHEYDEYADERLKSWRK